MKQIIEYVVNPDKTDEGLFVTYGYTSDGAEAAAKAFEETASHALNGGSITAYHIIQSFDENEVTAEQAHTLGLELCEKLLHGDYQFVLATHDNTDHIHNHIVVCSTNMDNHMKLSTLEDRKNDCFYDKIRRYSDELCEQYGLSVVENADIGKGVSHYEWEQKKKGTSWKAKLKDEIDFIIRRSNTFEDFLEKCADNDIEVVYQPDKKVNLKFRMSGQKKYTRASTLGYYYTLENIKKRIKNYSYHRSNIIDSSKFEAKGLQRWADIQNMKNVADMINMLEGYNIKSTAELKPAANVVLAERAVMSRTIDTLSNKINNISERIELVRKFQQMKPFHDEYKTLPKRKQQKFYDDNEPVINQFHEVGRALRSLYPDGKFPSVATLSKQRNDLEAERRELHKQYTQLKQKSADLDRASQTIEDYLESTRSVQHHKRTRNELE